jgi:acyl phosphate:glycerol-3-phosphate acyltransferase
MSGVDVLRFLVALALGYLLGSIPSGVLVSRLFGNVDPRTQGSGKTGATNVLRTLGPGPAVLVAVLDILKGVTAIMLARYLVYPLSADATGAQHNLQATAEALAGFGALLGHNFSIFLRFTGGRGVATGAGAIFAVTPIAGLLGVIAMAIPIVITRYVSLGSILGAVVVGLSALILALTGHDYLPHAIFAIAGASFVIFSHRDNIERLLQGTERRIGAPREA